MTHGSLDTRAARQRERERERERGNGPRAVSSLKKRAPSGFTLFELLLYVGIFAVSAGLLTGVLTTLTRVQVRENASVEVSTQAQFVIQRLQQLIRDASIVELPANTATSTLKLRMVSAALDPTCVQLSGGVVYLMQGNDGVNKQNCLATSTAQAVTLTDSRVVVNTLNFTKFSNPPAKDTTQINLTISYNSTNPQESVISRTLETAITKVSAAVFDSDIIPAADNVYNVGLGAQRWVNGYFANNLLVGYTSMTGGVAAFNGKVGVGTATPAGTLHVSNASSTNALVVAPSGNVGIGTANSNGLLEINANQSGNGDPTTIVDFLRFLGCANCSNWDFKKGTVGGGSVNDLVLTDENNERIRFAHGGNVGIGTTSPVNKLDVSGAVAIGSYAGVNTGPSNGLIVSGNVGIGTASPTVTAGVTPGSQTFTSSGTFTVPAGVTSVRVTLVGGGGGGGAGGPGPGGVTAAGGGGGGGGGQYLQAQTVSVTPGQQITVTVGAGGAGAPPDSWPSAGQDGMAGGNSTFLSLTAAGGGGGHGSSGNAGGAGGTAGGPGGTNGAAGSAGQTGAASGTNTGGTGGTGGNSNGTGGSGGLGGNNSIPRGGQPGSAGGNYGAGGGGGGGGSDIGGTSAGGAGGNGAPGFVQVSWGDNTAPGATTFLDITGSAPGIVLHATNTGDTAKQFGLTNTASGAFIDSVGAATATNNAIIFRVSGTDGALSYVERMRIQSNGNVGIGTTNPSTALDVNGTITGTTKNFAIPDPMKPGYTLVHSTLEGPEIAVFYRGEAHLVHGRATVTLPDYFEALTRKEGRTVLLTPKFTSEDEPISALAASAVSHGAFTVKALDDKNPHEAFFWEVKATREDQPPLQVEVPTR